MTKTSLRITLTAAIALTSANCLADSTLQFSAPREGQPNTVYVRNGKVRMDGPGGASVFDAKARSITMLNTREQAYQVMTEKGIDERMQAMAKMRDEMMARMQDMPEEQRRAMEQYMPGPEKSAGTSAPITTRDTGKKDTVAGVSCRVYEALQNDQVLGQTCVATHKDLGMSSADYQAIKDMFSFMQDMASKAAKTMGHAGNTPFDQGLLTKLDGLPVRMTNGQQGGITLVSIKSDTLSDDLFKVPAGYKDMSAMQPPGMPGQP